MRVSSQVVGAGFGLLMVIGCSSADPDGQPAAGAGDAGTSGATVAGASNAGSGGSSGGGGGLAGTDPGGSAGLVGNSGGSVGQAGASAAGGGGAAARRLSIRFDYRFDTQGFFTPEKRAALEAAGALWSSVIADDFAPVPKGTGIRLRNPENRDEYVWVEGIEEEIDDLLVFVGTSEAIPGLGRGGPSGTAETSDPTLLDALNTRRDGPDFEPWAGSISFKASSNFFFDPTPDTASDIPPETYDFISNAAHELGHVLGFNSCDAFTAFTSGTSFIGPTAQAAYGGPVPLATDLAHFPNDLQSAAMETLMDAGQANGVRSIPTPLDRAVFADLGYEISN